ncbi:hypothetical protein ANO11243_083370 [Dothideomycetidae sp. 11243]|nr:hypothetical protein ANO11243_083370 [fungal sp. No.11243]
MDYFTTRFADAWQRSQEQIDACADLALASSFWQEGYWLIYALGLIFFYDLWYKSRLSLNTHKYRAMRIGTGHRVIGIALGFLAFLAVTPHDGSFICLLATLRAPQSDLLDLLVYSASPILNMSICLVVGYAVPDFVALVRLMCTRGAFGSCNWLAVFLRIIIELGIASFRADLLACALIAGPRLALVMVNDITFGWPVFSSRTFWWKIFPCCMHLFGAWSGRDYLGLRPFVVCDFFEDPAVATVDEKVDLLGDQQSGAATSVDKETQTGQAMIEVA